MNELLCLIDTNVLSYILKQREPFYQRSQAYLTHLWPVYNQLSDLLRMFARL